MNPAARCGAGVLACAVGAAAAAVTEVYPSGPQVPENLLRIELRLSKPLHVPLDMRRVALLDAQGHPIAEPFLDLPLPSADGRRIALLLHPARVKTGVGANEAFGRALHAGEVVTLAIDDPGVGAPVRKTWRIEGLDHSRPSPERWTFTAPVAGTRQPLIVRTIAPISAASEGLIGVRAGDGHRVTGRVVLSDGETVWRFIPTRPWPAARHWVVVHPDLEDPAGNRRCARFEQVGEGLGACHDEWERPFDVRR